MAGVMPSMFMWRSKGKAASTAAALRASSRIWVADSPFSRLSTRAATAACPSMCPAPWPVR